MILTLIESDLLLASAKKEDKPEGLKADPLSAAVEFCRGHLYSYEPALETLDQMYRIGFNVKYKETETNL